ncbi:ChrR family anti-sigma-E factor [Saccharospirillum salsuginis]|uniref:Transcriptional regulator n=1 Tax=Saccharospirillum salsuginis TaxID=418750 RepID=A0A918KNY3_9GAMM|nr:ChrR family anti-sigma-E factor [Saccharospirillum salsuginis]GGX70185.1 transcriptional regulator [Saccharospirillum salsuginis]
MTQWHPQTEQLVEYAAGSCNTGMSVAISVHLHYCKHCRERVSELESATAVLFETQAPAPVADGTFDQLMQRIQREPTVEPVRKPAPQQRFPRALQSLLPESLDELNWRHPMKNLSVSHLLTDETGMIIGLHHMKAGGRVPNHTHRGDEINVVLEGGFSDQMGSYGEGDFVFRTDNDTHAPQADAHEDCLMLSVVTAPVKLTGPLGWLVNPFIKP